MHNCYNYYFMSELWYLRGLMSGDTLSSTRFPNKVKALFNQKLTARESRLGLLD